jgi:hypothetical protein
MVSNGKSPISLEMGLKDGHDEQSDHLIEKSNESKNNPTSTTSKLFGPVALEFFLCFLALQISYLLWGIMQELIMSTKYEPTPLVPDGELSNNLLALKALIANRY